MLFDEEMTREQLEEILENLDQYVALGQILIPLVRDGIIKKCTPLAADALKTLVQVYIDLSQSLEPEINKISTQSANRIYDHFAHYMQAGFSKQEAFALVLASVKPVSFTENISNITKQVSTKKSS